MGYNMKLPEMITTLKSEDAEYFPFEQIRSYRLLREVPEEVVSAYRDFFTDTRRTCEALIKKEPNHRNTTLWEKAIVEIDKL